MDFDGGTDDIVGELVDVHSCSFAHRRGVEGAEFCFADSAIRRPVD
jgi:hypothetical protein